MITGGGFSGGGGGGEDGLPAPDDGGEYSSIVLRKLAQPADTGKRRQILNPASPRPRRHASGLKYESGRQAAFDCVRLKSQTESSRLEGRPDI